MTVRIGVVTFPGSLDDRDACRAIRLAGAEPVHLWHASDQLSDVDAIVLPGGFSYGDYLRAGAIARFAPIMSEVITAAGRGMPVLGICNGFQVLTEAHLLPGSMIRNDHRMFLCREQALVIANNKTAWTNTYARDERIVIPLKNQDGQYVTDDDTYKDLHDSGRIVCFYAENNPNGSRCGIAGVTNKAGNVVGLMPHPEHAVEPVFGPEAESGATDGLGFFQSAIAALS